MRGKRRTKNKPAGTILRLAVIPLLIMLCLVFPMVAGDVSGNSVIIETSAKLYEEPSWSAKALATLYPGTEATALETLAGGWRKLKTDEGLTGYIAPAPNTADVAAMEIAPTPTTPPPPINPIPYTLNCAAALFRQPSTSSGVLRHLSSGDKLELTGDKTDTMVRVRLEDGLIGFLDQVVVGEEMLKELTLVNNELAAPKNVSNLFSEENMALGFEEKLELLRELFPNKKYWNSVGIDLSGLSQEWAATITTDWPCDHSYNGCRFCHQYNGATLKLFDPEINIQCLGFASMISDFLFGKDAPISILENPKELRPGDHIRNVDLQHSMVVTAVFSDSLRVVQCNSDYDNCQILWDEKLSFEDLEGYELMLISRREKLK